MNILQGLAKETIGKKKDTKKNWITEETLREVEERRKIKSKGIKDPVQEAIYKQQNSKIRYMIRKDKESFVDDQCKQIEENATTNYTRELFTGVKSRTRKFCPTVDTIKDKVGKILCNRDLVND